jgi:hypothetical protein
VVTATPKWCTVPIRVAIPAALTSAPVMVTPRPNLGASRAAAPEETSTPAENGRKVSPACSGVKPIPSCRNRVSTRANEAMPRKNVMATVIPALNARSRNRLSWTSGEPSRRVLIRSYQTNAANTGADSAMDTNVQAGQPNWRPCTSG